MTTPSDIPKHIQLAAAIAAARLRALRTGLLPLHRALIESERRRYEEAHGLIETPQQAFQLVMHDPFFAWLRPMLALIVTIDERLAEQRLVTEDELTEFRGRARRMLLGEHAEFREAYQRALQTSTDVAVAHGRVAAVLRDANES